jgi:threonine/homoserine/homoserine lactone efflux protein
MTIGMLFSIVYVLGTILSLFFEHKKNNFVNMFNRDPNTWSIINTTFGVFLIIALILLVIEYWDTVIF